MTRWFVIAAALAWSGAAFAQSNVQVTGPIAKGDTAIFNSPTIVQGSSSSTNPTIYNNDQLFGSGRPWCDVRAKGAVGDNVTDDTAAFQACVTQLTVGGANHLGGTIYVSMGTNGIYCLFTGLSITAGLPIEIVGISNPGSTSLSTCGHDVTLLSLNNARHGVRNLGLLGPNIVGTTNDTLVLSAGCTECTVDNVAIAFGRYGINDAADDVKMTTINVHSALGAALVYSTGSFSCNACKLDSQYPVLTPSVGVNRASWASTTTFSRGAVVSSGGYWWQAANAGTSGGSAPTTQPYNTYIQDNVTGTCPSPSAGICWLLVDSNPSASVQCDSSCSTVAITNRSDLSGAFDYGLYITGTGQSVIFSNSFISAYQYGVYDTSSVGGLVATGNQCSNIINTSGACFYVRSSDDVISNNVMIAPGQIGVQTDAGKNYTFANNQIWGATLAAIYIGGSVTNVSVIGNIIGSSANWGTNALGVDIATSGSDYLTITGNQCHGASACISNSSTGTHNLIETTPGIFTGLNLDTATSTFKLNGATIATAQDLQAATHQAVIEAHLTGINVNALGDNAIAIPTLPTGYTHFQVWQVLIRNSGSTASLTSAQYGVFTAASGGGVALVASGTALTALTSNTTNATGNFTLTNAPAQTIVLDNTITNIYFRVTQVQGASAAVDVTLQLRPMP